MSRPFKLIDVELSLSLPDIDGLAGYAAVQALLRLHGVPVGYVRVPVVASRCSADRLAVAIVHQQGERLWRRLGQRAAVPADLRFVDLAQLISDAAEPPPHAGPWPAVTVAVCTRDRPDTLARCLDSLASLDYPDFEILVVDNAPSDDRTREMLAKRFPSVRRVLEPVPGLSRARNRAIMEAVGEIIAFTDDDVDVDPAWLRTIAAAFVRHDAAAVTGLVVPSELDTEAQVFIEAYGGFGSGMDATVHRAGPGRPPASVTALECGTGANMAFHREALGEVGLFDPGLGAGSRTGGGEELEMFFRLLNAGHTLVYEPAAIVRHQHYRAYHDLRRQMASWGSGFAAYGLTCARKYPDQRRAFARLGLRWLAWQVRRLGSSVLRPPGFPRSLILVEVGGALQGIWRYRRARRDARTDAVETARRATGRP